MKYLEGTHSPSPWSGRLGGGGGGGLAGWLVGWLAGWSGWLVGWLAGWVRIIGFDTTRPGVMGSRGAGQGGGVQ